MTLEVVERSKMHPAAQAHTETLIARGEWEFDYLRSRADRSPAVTEYYGINDDAIIGRMGLYDPENIFRETGNIPIRRRTFTLDHQYGIPPADFMLGHYFWMQLPNWAKQVLYIGDVVIFDKSLRGQGFGREMVQNALKLHCRDQSLVKKAFGITLKTNEAMLKVVQALNGHIRSDDLVLGIDRNASSQWRKSEKLKYPFWWQFKTYHTLPDNSVDIALVSDTRNVRNLALIIPERKVPEFNTEVNRDELNGQIVIFLNPNLQAYEIQGLLAPLSNVVCGFHWANVVQLDGGSHAKELEFNNTVFKPRNDIVSFEIPPPSNSASTIPPIMP